MHRLNSSTRPERVEGREASRASCPLTWLDQSIISRIALMADPSFGETEGGVQAPFVLKVEYHVLHAVRRFGNVLHRAALHLARRQARASR